MNDVIKSGATSSILEGHVKWFNTQRGFGFVRADSGGKDILLHINVLREFGQSSIAENARLKLEVDDTDRGRQASRIIELIRPDTGDQAPLPELAELSPEAIDLLPFLPARLKWFDRTKGFGFATLFADSRDTFLHVDVVRKGGMEQPSPGEALALRVLRGKRGLIAVDVLAWDRLLASAAK